MLDIGWDEAIQQVLSQSSEALHYKAIAEEIANLGLRQSLGATPANTVNAYINTDIKDKGESSRYLRMGRGYYQLRNPPTANNFNNLGVVKKDEQEPTGLVLSLGMYWQASKVDWKSAPRLLGQQQIGSDPVNFAEQIGVYILYDRSTVKYVGRSIERPMGQRLYEHTKDRLSGRWDRFSWFGLRGVSEEGALQECKLEANDSSIVIATLEAVLIEALEPPQNRKRGDQFSAVEYLQATDPEKERKTIDAVTALISGSLKSMS